MNSAFEFWVFALDDLANIALHARTDDEAAEIAHALRSTFNEVIRKAKSEHPAVCLCCDHVFAPPNAPPFAFGLVLEMFPDRTKEDRQAVGTGICRRCLDRPDFMDLVKQSLQEAYPGVTMREMRLDS